MKTKAITITLTFLLTQVGFSQKNDSWAEATIFTKSDTIQGFIKSNSISFESIKFKKNLDDSAEHLTPEFIEGYQINDYLYEKVFVNTIGTLGSYKFGKLMEQGKFKLYQTTEQSYSNSQNDNNDIYILTFNNLSIKFKLNAFYKLKNKKQIAKKLDGYDGLQNIILKKDFDFNTFIDEIKSLNSK